MPASASRVPIRRYKAMNIASGTRRWSGTVRSVISTRRGHGSTHYFAL
jgi:hypothetical protein